MSMGRRAAWLLLPLAALLVPASAGAAAFSNPAPIASPAVPGSGVAIPYPSAISVSGMQGTTVKVRATLRDLTAAAKDVDVLLTGPGASTILLSDPCSASLVDFGADTLTFDDDAAATFPESCPAAPASGTYRPSNNDTTDAFPGVPGPYPLGLSNFRGLSPNGLWQLYLFDDSAPDAALIAGGWSLELTTTRAAGKKKCRKRKKGRSSAKRKRCKKAKPRR